MRVDRIEGQPSKVDFSVIDALEWDKDKQTILRAKLEKNQLIAEFVRKLEDYQNMILSQCNGLKKKPN
jgi:hypothetical protein